MNPFRSPAPMTGTAQHDQPVGADDTDRTGPTTLLTGFPPDQDDDRPRLLLSAHGQSRHVPYQLRHSARARRLGLRIGLEGLVVTLPQRARLSRHQIEDAIRQHAAWVLEKLPHWQARADRQQAQRPDFSDGGWVPLMGKRLTLRLQTHLPQGRIRILRMGDELWISGPATRSPELLARALHQWLKQQALHTFNERLLPFTQALGRSPRAVSLSSARTRWGSCARNGDIRLNWRLIQFAPELIDYVIVHELAHLIEMNHSPRFWAQVAALMPDYRQHKDALARSVDAYLG
ncbi:MAG: SprT family zinc-dependent metalloprotease [Lautropia sp.]|nr:SprT family zinc-dependent metalloprotease [Lautropia sp.]